MISEKNAIRISGIVALVTWLVLLVLELFLAHAQANFTGGVFEMPEPKVYFSYLLFDIFLVSLYLFFRLLLSRQDNINFVDMLWRVFVTGLVVIVVSLALRGLDRLFEGFTTLPPYLGTVFHLINLGCISAFLLSTFTVWKRLILYQKTKRLLKIWQAFEITMLASVLLNFTGWDFTELGFKIALGVLVAMALTLSVNLKWVAYLNFKQKWKSILLILLMLLYVWYFFTALLKYGQPVGDLELAHRVSSNVLLLALFAFIFLYAVSSLLVILFNLPTSSVFEQKLEEVINFQRLSQSIQTGQREDQVYSILLESSVNAVFADAAWLEIHGGGSEASVLMKYQIGDQEIDEVKQAVSRSRVRNILDSELDALGLSNKITATLRDSKYKSILVYTLLVQNKPIGNLALLKEVLDGFNKEMMDIINTFVNQACVSIENFRLLSEALENERYKEELKIAKRVQRSLLPSELDINDGFEMAAFSEAADEVGGDYYDTYKINDHKVVIIIGDVSGKGTSAAFNMSQMKGVFHSLVQLDPTPKEFLVYANNALSHCLEKTSFITASFFIIDTQAREIEFARAGHCPTLYYNNERKETYFFKNRGLGLGILRNADFHKYVQVNKIKYNPGDIIFLYTDGITEAKNLANEEFGYENLQDFVLENAHYSPLEMQDYLIQKLYNYCDKTLLNDDYTSLIIKFR